MKMRTFDLRMYKYEEFLGKAKEYVFNNSDYEGQMGFLFEYIDRTPKKAFLEWAKEGLVIALVINGSARKKIPVSRRHFYVESTDAAFILY